MVSGRKVSKKADERLTHLGKALSHQATKPLSLLNLSSRPVASISTFGTSSFTISIFFIYSLPFILISGVALSPEPFLTPHNPSLPFHRLFLNPRSQETVAVNRCEPLLPQNPTYTIPSATLLLRKHFGPSCCTNSSFPSPPILSNFFSKIFPFLVHNHLRKSSHIHRVWGLFK